MFIIRHEHHHHLDPQVEARLRNIEHKLGLILRNTETMMDSLAQITAATERTEGVSLSIRTHLEALGKYIMDNLDNSAALKTLADRLQKSADDEEAAIVANPLPGTRVPPQ